MDVVTIRENTEGEYSGLEHIAVPGVAESLKIISEKSCRRVAIYAFEFAEKMNRKKVEAVHKAGVMKLSDGLFLDVCRDVSTKYPNIEYKETQVNTMAHKLILNPEKIDVMVMPNLYGDIISDLCAGMIGGLGLTASGNIGSNCAVFEAVHGTAPDIAGRNLANPTALLLSACMMLEYMGLQDHGERIREAVFKVLDEKKTLTGDIGGNATTRQFTDEIIKNFY